MLNHINCLHVELAQADYNAEAVVLFLCKECLDHRGGLQLPEELDQAVVLAAAKYEDFYETGVVHSLAYVKDGQLKHLLLAGCGQGRDCRPVNFKKAAGKVARELRSLKVTKATVAAPIVLNEVRAHYLQAIAEGLYLGAYSFNTYKSEAKEPKICEIALVNSIPGGETVLKRAEIIAGAVSMSRDLVNEPGNVVYPESMAQKAAEISQQCGLELEVLDEAKMAELGMRALLAVGQGSERGSRMIVLRYQGNGDAPYVAYVGKGITFDSGGISIKPDDNMGEMKDDMTGAACVLGAMKAVAELGLRINLLAVLCCAENMPDGKAQRPGDIVRAANGKTIEVVSTDAEGRMVLADGVWYAGKLGAKKIVDIATLTGAVIVALGTETSAIVSNDDELAEQIAKAGKLCGESWWRLPELPECKEAIKSDVADVLNSAGRAGGCITGGLFIQEFAEKGIPFAHLDIGGTSTATKTEGFKVKGGTAFGTMTLVKLAEMM